jgi:hypothetical protein
LPPIVKNNLNGAITLAKPVPSSDRLTIVSPKGDFTIQPNGEKTIVLRVLSPTSSESPVNTSLGIHLANNAGVENEVNLAIAKSSADLLPPPGLGCGTINPRMVATAFSDQAPGQGFDPKTSKNDAIKDVPEGNVNGFASNSAEYHFNGGGVISQFMDSTCTLLNGTRQSATTILSFATTTNAISGHCCSGFGPGGSGKTSPAWSEKIDLPGDSARDKWILTMIVRSKLSGGTPTCNIEVDGNQTVAQPNGQVRQTFTLAAGAHLLKVTCDAGEIGARPGAWSTPAAFHDELNITLNVQHK